MLTRAAHVFRTWNRRRKARWATKLATSRNTQKVLLVGAGGDEELWENFVEQAIAGVAPFAVWCGIEPRPSLANYIVCDGRSLPFTDQSFDLVFANAVLEHVGGVEDQRRFIAEHDRVGRCWALTTPNRWFPVESHTLAVLRHWSGRWRAGRSEFSRILSRRELAELLPNGARIKGSLFAPTFTAYRMSSQQQSSHLSHSHHTFSDFHT